MGGGAGEEGLRRRMPLRRAGGGGAVTSNATSLGGRAMRYYRLWIYTCNTALLAGALAFVGAAARTLVFDYRRALIPTLTLYQPSFLYAYLALLTQGGALQLLGCVAAIRLSERLLNAYWMLLLVLLFGDVVIGAFWAFRFERVCQELRPALRMKWNQDYNVNADFTSLWTRLEVETACCGPTDSSDYNQSKGLIIPPSCCRAIANDTCQVHSTPCEASLQSYLRSTASLLAILGYCVLAFLKFVFLGILRYEIREMIQKIRILRAELELPGVNGAVPGGIGRSGLDLLGGDGSERESLLVRPDSGGLLLSSPPVATKNPAAPPNPNGNNNYELREYNNRGSEGGGGGGGVAGGGGGGGGEERRRGGGNLLGVVSSGRDNI
ncbi:uncharacterized protein [Atheta coriaria]|uniref:uncharacterized protein n=1 Tax=Dalotia coriaria TaxID=877792 RepID=UPI0031F43494